MKSTVFALTASVVLAGTFALAQTPDPQPPAAAQQEPRPAPSAAAQPAPSSQAPSVPEIRITGCLTQGSSPTVFILDNARMSTDAKTAEGKKYIVVMTDAAGLRGQLNRQVTITGLADEKKTSVTVTTPPAGTPDAPGPAVEVKVEERDLPRFSAKTIVRVADVCTTT